MKATINGKFKVLANQSADCAMQGGDSITANGEGQPLGPAARQCAALPHVPRKQVPGGVLLP